MHSRCIFAKSSLSIRVCTGRLAFSLRTHKTSVSMSARPRCVLAFSGGLDTSMCVVYLREELGFDVITATVDTGGFPPEELEYIEKRSKELGALKHITINATEELFDDWIRYIIQANYKKGGDYPLSVGVQIGRASCRESMWRSVDSGA